MSDTRQAQMIQRFTAQGIHVATAESLTAGGLAATIADTPGASAVLNGGVISYTNQVKHQVLGVSQQTLEDFTAVSAETAREMAEGARQRCGADIGISTTGVAGPEPHEGQPVGTVYIGVATGEGSEAHRYIFDGERAAIRGATVAEGLRILENLSQDVSSCE